MSALERSFKDLVAELSHSLTDADVEQILELVAVNELGVAFENFCTQLYEREAKCSEEQIFRITEIGTAMGISPDYWKHISEA